MIQLRENYVSSAYANFSFALAVIIVSSYALLGMYFRYILNKIHPRWKKMQERRSISTATKRSVQKWDKVPDSLGILIEDFRENKRFARTFVLVMLLETFLQILVIFFFQENGLTQAILYIIIVLGFLILSAWKRPYKSNLHMAILLLNQGSKLVMGIIATLFGMNDKIQFISSELITLMGLILMLLILIVMGINFAISFLIVVISLYERIKEWRSRRQREHSNFGVRSREISRKKQNFLDEPRPSRFEHPSLDLHADSNQHTHQRHIYDNEERMRPIPRPKQTSTLKKVRSNHNSKENGRRCQIETNSISEIHITEKSH